VMARSKLRRGEFWARVVSEGLGKEKWVNSAPVPHLNANSRLSDSVSLKRDERERKIQKVSRRRDCVAQITPGAGHSRPGETLLA